MAEYARERVRALASLGDDEMVRYIQVDVIIRSAPQVTETRYLVHGYLNAPDFKGLAPLTWIGRAEFDPHRDEAEAYGKRLEMAGNKVVISSFLGVLNLFMHMDNVLLQGCEYIQDVTSDIRQCLYVGQTPVRTDVGAIPLLLFQE